MARTQNNKSKLYLMLSVVVLILLVSGVFAFITLRKPDEFNKLSAFPIDSYLEGTDLWSHEDFRLEGRVDNVVLRSPSGTTLLLSLQPKGSALRLPILLQTKDGKIPIQRDQTLVMKVNLGNSSEINCQTYELR